MKDSGGLDWSDGSRSNGRGLDSGSILKAELSRFADILGLGSEWVVEGRVKTDSKVWSVSKWNGGISICWDGETGRSRSGVGKIREVEEAIRNLGLEFRREERAKNANVRVTSTQRASEFTRLAELLADQCRLEEMMDVKHTSPNTLSA